MRVIILSILAAAAVFFGLTLLVGLVFGGCAGGDPYLVDWSPHDVRVVVDGEPRDWLPGGLSVPGGEEGCLELEALGEVQLSVVLAHDLKAAADFCLQTIPHVPVEVAMDHGATENRLRWSAALGAGGALNLCPAPSARHVPCD